MVKTERAEEATGAASRSNAAAAVASRQDRVARYATVAKMAAVIPAVASPASAGLQIWSVGVALPQVGDTGPTSMNLQLAATFNTAFQINFFGSLEGARGPRSDQVFWAPNNNLSFINAGYSTYNDPAIWLTGFTADANAMNGVASAGGYTTHIWFAAIDSRNSAHDIQSLINSGETGAFGIRFSEGADYYYGWVEVSLGADGILTVERWALEDTVNAPAQYGMSGGGAVPGGAGLAALALGAAGLRGRRRGRN